MLDQKGSNGLRSTEAGHSPCEIIPFPVLNSPFRGPDDEPPRGGRMPKPKAPTSVDVVDEKLAA